MSAISSFFSRVAIGCTMTSVCASAPSSDLRAVEGPPWNAMRSEEHTSELQSLMRISYAVFCLKKKHKEQNDDTEHGTDRTPSPRSRLQSRHTDRKNKHTKLRIKW